LSSGSQALTNATVATLTPSDKNYPGFTKMSCRIRWFWNFTPPATNGANAEITVMNQNVTPYTTISTHRFNLAGTSNPAHQIHGEMDMQYTENTSPVTYIYYQESHAFTSPIFAFTVIGWYLDTDYSL
jgi:hypothetical protein